MEYQEWDTEDVLAFVYDVVSWRDMDEPARLVWCQRVQYLIGNITTDGKRWTQGRAAPALGIAQSLLSRRLAWSERFLASDPDKANGIVDPGPRSPVKQTSDARRAFSNPNITPQVKAELVAKALTDPDVARHVVANQKANTGLARARQEHAAEATSMHEARDPELKSGRIASESATLKHELARIRNLLFASIDSAHDFTEDVFELAAEVIAAAQALMDARNFDAELASLIEGGQ